MRAAHAAIDARDAGLEARLHARFEGQLSDLRKQVAELQARLEPTKPKPPPAKKPHDTTALEPISYNDAFDQLGGQAALDGYRERSKQLIERTRDDALEKELADLQMTERRGFSTALVNQRFVEDLDELYDDARRAMPGFFATCQDLASKTQATFHAGAEKCSVRARMKALFKYKDCTGVAYHRFTDVVRCTLSYSSLQLLYDGFEKVLDLFGDDVKEAHDRYQQPLGDYRDIQLVVSHENHLCELQLTTELYMRAKATTGHRTFEVIRELKAAVADGDSTRVDTALSWGHCSQLKDLLRTQASTLLAEASKKGHAGIVARLLRAGADANAPANDGETALHAAIR